MKEEFRSWFMGETDPMEELFGSHMEEDLNREQRKRLSDEKMQQFEDDPETQMHVDRVRGRFRKFYYLVAVASCVFLSVVLL